MDEVRDSRQAGVGEGGAPRYQAAGLRPRGPPEYANSCHLLTPCVTQFLPRLKTRIPVPRRNPPESPTFPPPPPRHTPCRLTVGSGAPLMPAFSPRQAGHSPA
jgi:hypothetical protein